MSTRLWIDTAGGLVQEDNLRTTDESNQHAQLSLLTTAQLLGPSVLALQLHRIEQMFDLFVQFLAPHSFDASVELKMLEDGELLEQNVFLEADAHRAAQLAQVFWPVGTSSVHLDGALGGGDRAGEDVDQRRLARTILAEQTCDLRLD